MAKDNSTYIDKYDDILNAVKTLSNSMYNYMLENPNSNYIFACKFITHSDLAAGKRTDKSQGYEKNVLYYLTIAEMEAMRHTQVAHQSNMIVPSRIYDHIGIPKVKGNVIHFKLVNDTAQYFNEYFSYKVVTALGKEYRWLGNSSYTLSDGDFTNMTMTVGDQGVGTANDEEFQNLRRHIFANDAVCFMVETKPSRNSKLFVMLEKNPKFFEVLSIKNDPWRKTIDDYLKDIKLVAGDEKKTEVTQRQFQNAWKNLLAKEMMNYVQSDSKVFCPFTFIKADFFKVPMLFIASHIKRHADSDIYEKYDPNNGLLLCANADALFDKYIITIGEDKNLIFSCLIQDDDELKSKLLIDHEIFKQVLNDQRMEYMKDHRAQFFEKEIERAETSIYLDDDDEISPERTSQTDTTQAIVENPPVVETIPKIPILYAPDYAEDRMVADTAFVYMKRSETKGLLAKGEDTILVGCYKNLRHNKWIVDKKLYNIRLGNRHGSYDESQIPDANILILYENHFPENNRAFFLKKARKITSAEIKAMQYPNPKEESEYFLFEVGDECYFKYDIKLMLEDAKKKLGNEYHEGMPIFIEK